MSKTPLTFTQAKPFIEADLKAGQTPALMGLAGIGKSSLINDLARVFKTKVFTLPINQLADRADLTGVRMVQTESGSWAQKAFPHYKIMSAVEYAQDNPDEYPILFLDEFNRASSDITSAVLSLQTERAIGSIEFPDNLRIIVAGNDKGNVTPLDEASISRFAVYYVKPDLETFLTIQELNPFVQEVLTKHPDDLMATEMVENTNADSDDDDDEDSDSEEFAFSQFEFLGEDSFSQVTRPRTITYVSEWLDNLGLDKSGSDKEKELLGNLFTNMTDTDNVLLAGIEAHVGLTSFAYHLYDEIHAHFNNMLSANHTSSKPVLMNLRPKQDIVNALSRAQDVPEVEQLINTMNDTERQNTLIWLTEIASTKEINNNNAVQAFMQNAPHFINKLEGASVQNLMKVLADPTRVSEVAVRALVGSSAPVMDQWRTVISSVLEQD